MKTEHETVLILNEESNILYLECRMVQRPARLNTCERGRQAIEPLEYTNTPIDSADTYRRFLSGDAAAAEELLNLYGQGLTLFLFGFVGDMDDAEDLTVETFARVMVKARPIKDGPGLKAYLFTTGRNLALRHLKKHRHEKHLSLEDLMEQADGDVAGGPEPAFLRDEKNHQIYAAMQLLKVDHREVLHLLYFEEMSYAEAGRVLGKTPKQMDNLVQYAKQKLKTELERQGVSGYEDE